MSEFYFCFFCDTIVLSLDQLNDHLAQHLTEEDDNQNNLSNIERQFVANFLRYEQQISASMALMPKELPRDSVQKLLIGCPTCDAIIRCYDLIPNEDNKDICHCDRQLPDMPTSKCIQCQSKNFDISYLKCLPFDAQRDHCYQHLNYYPFICRFGEQTGDHICNRQLITSKACEKHLIFDHKYCLNGCKDIFDVLSTHFDYHPIQKIDDLINNRLNSKSNINLTIPYTHPKTTLSAISCIDRNEVNPLVIIANDEFNTSFHYTSEVISRNYPKNKRHLEQIPDHNYMRSHSLDDSFDDNLEYIPIPDMFPKKRGRPKGSKNKFTTSDAIAEVVPIADEVVDLTHRRQYLNWFTQTKATKYPYFPQKDDEVYYLPYGHELYKQEIMKRGLYNQSNRNFSMRFFNYDRILAKVAKIDFLFKERRRSESVIRCIYVTLRPCDPKYGTIIHVKYHDMEGVLDFIILKELYESSIEKVWRIGDQFRSIIDDRYWFGVVIGYNSAPYCELSHFKKYQIQWHSNDANDFLSPWDLEPIEASAPNSAPIDHYSSVPITDADRQLFFRTSQVEWPNFNEEKELRRLAKGLKIIYKMDKTTEFPILQDLTDSRYREKILYPVDMKTFIARIENHFYRRHLAIKYDIKFLESNIRKLVKSVKRDPEYRLEESIARRLKYHTKFVTALCLLFIDTHDCKNPYDLYPNIDDYLETHDVKCYSAKRVHLNMRKKFPNCLPAPHKRLPKRPQSFGDSAKTLKIFKALSNTETLNRRHSTPEATTSSSTVAKPAPKIKQMVVPFKDRDDILYPHSDSGTESEKSEPSFKLCSNICLNNSFGQNVDYSSDVSRSENEYQKIECLSNKSDDTDVDPDFEATTYYKRHLF